MKQLVRFFVVWMAFGSLVVADNGWKAELVVEHVKKIQKSEQIDLQDFAVSKFLDSQRIDWLKRRMPTLILPKVKSGYEFAVRDSKVDGDIALALLEITTPNDPMFVAIQPIAYFKVAGKWLPAPLWASFEMTDYGSLDTRQLEKRQVIEQWGQERSNALQSELSKQRQDQFFNKVTEYVNSPELHKDAETAVFWFIEQVQKKNVAAVGASLGVDIKDSVQSDPFEFHGAGLPLHALIRGMSENTSDAWNKLRGKDYLFAVLPKLKRHENMVSLAMYFANQDEREQILEFRVSKNGKRWVVSLPSPMCVQNGEFGAAQYSKWNLDQDNRDRIKKILPTIISSLKSNGINDLSAMLQKIQSTSAANDIRAWCEMIDWNAGTKVQKKQRFYAALDVWVKLRKSSGASFQELQNQNEAEAAVLSMLLIPNSRPQAYEVLDFVMCSVGGIWYWRPELNPRDAKQLPESLVKRYSESYDNLKSSALKKLCAHVEIVNAGQIKTMAHDVREKLLDSYRSYAKALTQYNLPSIFSQTASVAGGEGDLLRAVSADLRGVNDTKSNYHEEMAIISGTAGGVMVRLTHMDTNEKEYLLYFGYSGKSGPRLLPQMIYFYEHGRGQEILNKQMLKDSLPQLGTAFQGDAQQVIESFNTAVAKELEKQASPEKVGTPSFK